MQLEACRQCRHEVRGQLDVLTGDVDRRRRTHGDTSSDLGWPEVQSGAVGVDEGCDAIRESRLAAGRPGGHAEQVAGPRAKREREMDEARRVFGLPPAKKPARELRTYGFGGSVTASR